MITMISMLIFIVVFIIYDVVIYGRYEDLVGRLEELNSKLDTNHRETLDKFQQIRKEMSDYR